MTWPSLGVGSIAERLRPICGGLFGAKMHLKRSRPTHFSIKYILNIVFSAVIVSGDGVSNGILGCLIDIRDRNSFAQLTGFDQVEDVFRLTDALVVHEAAKGLNEVEDASEQAGWLAGHC